MPNNYFQFKQFTIQQEKCAMKVCTDSCLFGAYTANMVLQQKWIVNRCLDIGTGTGLLTLMLAQKITTIIDAVEINEAAFQQAKDNIETSEWADRIQLYHADINEFTGPEKYNLIISNPPFYERDLQANALNKNQARHDTALTFIQLFCAAKKNLEDNGIFALLLPYHRIGNCTDAALITGLHCSHQLLIQQTPAHDYFRAVLFFSANPIKKTEQDAITIKDEMGNYNPKFIALLRDYYLFL